MNRKQLYVELETTKKCIKRGGCTLSEGAERMIRFVEEYKESKIREIDSFEDVEEYNDVLDSTIAIYHRVFLDLAALTR